jgi:hypothetical protein
MKKKLLKSMARVLGTVAVVVLLIWITIAQPSCRRNGVSKATVDSLKLREHVETLSQRLSPRDWQHWDNLDRCADYIGQHFRDSGATVEFQPVMVGGRQYRNVIGRFNAGNGASVVVGAHYDTCGEQPGSDDNASGVAGLIELAYLVGSSGRSNAVDLVAYVLEEPPFFRTVSMGSAIHAKSIADNKANIRGVIVLEMIGYFKDEWGSQTYSSPLLYLMYPSRANFIAVVSRWDQGDWIKTVKAGMAGTTDLPVYSMRAPSVIPGIDFSDHINYWPYGINALMITDTAFYRNKAYHSAGDTADRLDYSRLSQVVVAVFETIKAK